ncbi:MAG: DUF2339 domain-containing protein, partial [Cytophagaceae bacterium]
SMNPTPPSSIATSSTVFTQSPINSPSGADTQSDTVTPSTVTPSNTKPIPKTIPNQPRPPATPREPALGEKIFSTVKNFFTEGNPIVRIGMVVMFFGVSFLVKYASSQGLLPIEFRLSGVLLGAIALLVVGWKTRNRKGGYGLVLQGASPALFTRMSMPFGRCCCDHLANAETYSPVGMSSCANRTSLDPAVRDFVSS